MLSHDPMVYLLVVSTVLVFLAHLAGNPGQD